MNFNKFYELAKQNGLEVAELTQSKSSTFSIEIFKKEITSYSFKDTSRLTGRGIYNGKLGFVTTEKDDATTPLYIINSIKDAASVINSDDEAIIYKGAEKYKKKNVFNKELSSWAADDILKILFEIEEKLYAKDPRITDVEVAFERVQSALTFSNSYGLLIKNKSNFFDFVASITIKDGEEEVSLKVVDDEGNLLSNGEIVTGSNGKKYRLQNISLESNLKTTEKDVYAGKHLTWSIHNVSKEFALLSAAAATMFTLLSNRERKEMVTMTSSQIDYLVRTAREKFENESEFQRAVTTITNKSIDEELTASETLKHDLISQNITVEDINSLGGFSK